MAGIFGSSMEDRSRERELFAHLESTEVRDDDEQAAFELEQDNIEAERENKFDEMRERRGRGA